MYISVPGGDPTPGPHRRGGGFRHVMVADPRYRRCRHPHSAGSGHRSGHMVQGLLG